MSTARAGACSALLTDGRVLVAGGDSSSGVTNTVELYASSGSFTPGPAMNQARDGAACTTLLDGTVLVAGGSDGARSLASAEIFDPVSNAWTAVHEMAIARAGHTATLLPWGAVLIAGGEPSGTVEIYRTNGVFMTAGKLSAPRQGYAVAALSNRKVLIIGGTDGHSTLASMDVYNASDNSITPGGQLQTARRNFGAATLLDDTVLVTGGYDAGGNVLKSTEIFNLTAGQSVAGPDLTTARAEHQSYLLPNNGGVLIAGGTDGNAILTGTDLYTYWAARITGGVPMHTARTGAAASMLKRDGLLLAGGQNSGGFLPGTEDYAFATIATGKPDYHPGDVASMTGSGFKPGEQVQIRVTTLPVDQHNLEFIATATADGNGQIAVGGFNIDQGHLNKRFLLTATGSESVAQTTFTDGATVTTIFSINPASGTASAPAQLTIVTNVTGADLGQLIQLVIDGIVVDTQPLSGAATSVNTFNGSNEILGKGTHTIQASTEADSNNAGSTSTSQNYTVNSLSSATALADSNFGAAFNTSQPVTATVTGGGPTPTGTVTFFDQSTSVQLAVKNLNGSAQAVFDCAELLPVYGTPPAGNTHTILGTYSGDNNYAGSSNTATCKTAKILPTFVVTTSIPTSSITGGVEFNVTATGRPVVGIVTGTSFVPSSTVSLTAGSTATQALVNGATTFNNVVLLASPGSQSINVNNNVDPIFNNTLGPWPGITLASVPKTTPAVTVTTTPTSPVAGTSVTYKANVSAPNNFFTLSTLLPQGVVFTDGTNTSTTIALDSSGNASYTVTAPTVPTTITVTASWSGDSNFLAAQNSTSLTTIPGAATHFVVTAPASTAAGTAFNFTVTALDAFNNTATSYNGTVHFTSVDPQAVLPANSALTNGAGTFSATLKTAGSETITATDTVTASITGTSAGIAVSPTAATQFTVTGTPAETAGTAFNVTVRALDQFNNTATGYAGTVHFTSSDGAAVLPANSTLTNGATIFAVTLKTSGLQTVTGTDTVTASLTGSSNFAVAGGAVTHLQITAPGNATAGTAFNFTVSALDAFNNIATGYTGTVHFTSSDAAAILPANSTLTLSVGNPAVTLKTAGSQTITATDTVNSSITGTSGPIAVSPGAATHFLVAVPAGATAGIAFNFSTTALDAFNNIATGYAGTVHFTSSDGAAVLPANSTLTGGAQISSITLKTAGPQTITATDAVTTAITGTSNSIAVSAGPATHFLVTAPAVAIVATAFNFTVTALDAFNNTAPTYAGTVHFTSSDGAATLPANSTLTNGAGVFSATMKTAGLQTITGIDTAVCPCGLGGPITGTSAAITVTGAGAVRLIVSAPAAATAGSSFNFTVVAQDAFGNTAPSYAGTVRFTSTDASAAFAPASSTLTNGVGVFSAVLRTAGSQTITATDTANASFTGTTTAIQVVNPIPINGTVSTSSLTFQYFLGTNATALATQVSTGSTGAATFSVTSPVTWLTISGGSGSAGASFTVTPNPTGLAVGLYQTTLIVTFSGGGTAAIAVQLRIGAIQLLSSPQSLSFTAQAGSTGVLTGSVAIQALGTNVAATVATSGGAWLTATAAGSTTPFSVQATVNPAGLAAGTYNGSIAVTSSLATNSPYSIPVTLTITAAPPPPPSISVSAIVSGASMQPGPAAPNTIVSAFGTFPGCNTGAQVTVDGNATSVFASTPTQVNFLVPSSAASEISANVIVSCAGLTSQTVTLQIAALAPSIFTAAQSGTGQAAIVNQDGSIDTSSPAGTYIQVYGTGFGSFAPVGADGLAHLAQTVTATIGGVPATVLYAGQAPGYTNGLQQIDVLVPAGAPTGPSVPLVLIVGGVSTQAGVSIGVH